MTNEYIDILTRKQLVLIDFLNDYADTHVPNNTWKFKAEYSTNDNDLEVVVVQEQTGNKVIFYDENTMPLYNYYNITIYGNSIRSQKNLSLFLGNLIGLNYFEVDNNGTTEKWEIIFKQWSNFQPIEYQDIRRVGYTATMQCIVSKIN